MMKFNASFLAFLVAAFACAVLADDKSSGTLLPKSKGQCPGGYAHGTQMNIGRYWYECRDGQVLPKGCLTEEGRRVDLDDTFDTKQYRMLCKKDNDGFLTLIYKACMYNGAEHDVGSQWDDGSAFYTCVKESNNVRVITLGCVDQGKPLKLDERVAKGDFIYQCRKNTEGTPKMSKVGCIYEGKKYNIGELFDGPKMWYTCTDSGAKIVGCMYESHRLRDGDHFTKGDVMYTCRVHEDGADFEAFACMQREESGASIERRVGCFWVEGSGSQVFEYTCKEDTSSKTVAKVQTQCFYHASKGAFKIQPGCVQLAENIAVGCLRDSSSGKLRIETYKADQIDSLPGLKQC